MGKVKIKKAEIQTIVAVLGHITGIQSAVKCMSLASDYRNLLKPAAQEIEDALRTAKPEGYDELQKELQALKTKKGKELEANNEKFTDYSLGTLVLNTWEKTEEWRELNEKFNKNQVEIMKGDIEFTFKTKLVESDLPKSLDSVIVADVLGYFM